MRLRAKTKIKKYAKRQFQTKRISLRGVVCVGRKNKNITIQLNRCIDELLRIGEKKVKVNGRVDGNQNADDADHLCDK